MMQAKTGPKNEFNSLNKISSNGQALKTLGKWRVTEETCNNTFFGA